MRLDFNLLLFRLLFLEASFIYLLTFVDSVNQSASANVTLESPGLRNESVILWCAMTNQSIAYVQWIHENQILDKEELEDSGGEVVNRTHEVKLTKRNVWQKVGVYTCRFTSSTGQSFESHIVIYTPPVPVKHVRLIPIGNKGENKYRQESVTVVEGKSASITCEFHGYPRPNVSWYREDEHGEEYPLGDTDERLTFSESTGNYTLSISKAEFTDRANYICLAKNDIASVRVFNLLRIKGKLAVLWPSLGILFEIITFGAIIGVVQWREWKKSHSDDDDDGDGASNAPREDD